MIAGLFPDLRVFDGNEGVTNHLIHVLESRGKAGGEGRTEIDCSFTDPGQKQQYLEKCERMLRFCDAVYSNPER